MSRSPQITLPKEHEEHPWRTVALIISLLAVMVIIAYGVVTITAPEVNTDLMTGKEAISVAENPELTLFQRYAAAAQARAEMSFLANNPEIMIMRRYGEIQVINRDTNFLAQNPEIMALRRYVAPTGDAIDHDFLANNPEIISFRHYVGD